MNIEQNSNITTLKNTFPFDTFSDKQLEFIASFISLRKVGKNELIFSEGQKASSFFAIISGRLKIYKLSAEGQEHILEIHGKGDLVAEAAIFDKETYPAYCQAMEDSLLLRVPKVEFIEFVRKNPDASIQIMHSYSKRMRRLVKMLEELSMQDIKARLARYLLENADISGKTEIVSLTISKKELSSLLGTIPETLSRTLHFFRQEGLISVEKNEITILDQGELLLFAGY